MLPLLLLTVLCQNPLVDRQAALGERLARDFRRHTIPFPGDSETYVRAVGRRLLPPDAFWQFEVVKDDFGGPTREPIAFPGYIFVPARLLLMTGSEAELAGMLAHAIAHLEEPPEPVAFYTLDDRVPSGRVAAERARELAADRRAAAIAASAGYNPRALADYLRRVQPAASPKSSRLPDLAARLAAIDGAASAQPAREWIETTSAFSPAQEFARKYATRGRPHKPSLSFPR